MLTVVLSNKSVRALVATLVVATLTLAWAFSPPVGSEVLVTDRDGSTLIGFGVVRDSGLALELSVDTPEWRVVIVSPGGISSPYQASWNGERLMFENGSGERVDVADELASEGRGLTLAWWDGTRVDVPSDVVYVRDESDDDPSVAATDAGSGSELANNRPDEDAVTSAADPRDDDDEDEDGSDATSADPPTSDPDPDDPPSNRPDDEDDADAGDDGDANENDPPDNRPEPPTNDGGDDGGEDDSTGDADDGGANRR